MTNEEKAEEYAKGKAHEHYHFLFEENNGSPVDFAELCFFDGLSEGKPKWHDLRKDPNDLPQIAGDYLCRIYLYKADTTFPNVLYYDPSCKGFVLEEGGEPFEVKAWCELPKFEE